MDYQDAYLDISHENLAISPNAIYLIREDYYQEMLNNKVFMEQLAGKRVIRFVGDPAVAINMILTQEGILPQRVNGKDMNYDPALGEIFVNSMRDLCSNNNIDYSRNHGNFFGNGGHFSELLDQENLERTDFENKLSTFIREKIFELKGKAFNIYESIDKIIELVGYERLWKVIQEFNDIQRKNFLNRIRIYDSKHELDSSTHMLFVETIQIIKTLYAKEESLSDEEKQLIIKFFHSRTVDEQIEAADKIKSLSNHNAK